MQDAVYLDYNATTPTDSRVVEAMLPYFTQKYGNSMSLTHEFGWDADKAVEAARTQVAQILGCQKTEITWTSGATESNNWAIQGVIEAIRREDPKAPIHILSSPVEHSSVMMALDHARQFFGAEIEFLPIEKDGSIDPESVRARIRPDTRLVTVMWVQNEIGRIYPIREIGQICREKKVYFMSDATQAIGKIPVNLGDTHVDLVSFSAHKLYGPKGVGFLYHRKQNPFVNLVPLIYGGGHESGERSGTLNVPGIVGLACAMNLAEETKTEEAARLQEMREYLWRELNATYAGLELNGPSFESGERVPHNLNVTFTAQKLPPHIPQLAFSRGSACYSGKTSSSHVLKAIGLSENDSQNTLRLSMGRMTTMSEITQAIEIIRKTIKATRA